MTEKCTDSRINSNVELKLYYNQTYSTKIKIDHLSDQEMNSAYNSLNDILIQSWEFKS